MRKFDIGDKVRLVPNTTLWASHESLRDKVGRVKALVDDGTGFDRITIEYDGVEEFIGISSGLFLRTI